MDVSIIIVSYNVKHFLKQCIQSVQKALDGLDGEIIVVDNDSTDGSRQHIESCSLSKNIIWIQNQENVGFSKANNQGLKIAKGRYTLLLNPDTIVKSDSLKKSIFYLDNNSEIGGLGIKMIDGSGKFLPESKRSYPTPQVAFYKLFGLSKLFPNNNNFGKYHLTFLNKEENHVVDVLSGAFFFFRTKDVLALGGLDEQFFMYGEDIDLSFNIQQAGYKNVYLSDSKILHYKGESAKKGSLNYVKNFYKAMIIFARKHYPNRKQSLFVSIMSVAIALRGIISLITSFLRKIGLLLIDGVLSFLLLYGVKEIWLIAKPEINDYLPTIYYVNFPLYILLGIVTMYISGAYDSPYKLPKILRGGVYTVLVIALAYAFLPQEHRFSRAMVVLAGAVITIVFTLNRMIIQYLQHGSFSFYRSKKRSFILLGDEASLKIKDQLLQESSFYSFLGLVTKHKSVHGEKIGDIHQIDEILQQLQPTDVIVDTRVVTYDFFIETLERFGQKTKFHTTSDLGETIISSHDSNINGDIYDRSNQFLLSLPSEQRKKRLFDLISSIILLLMSPLLIWFQKRKLNYIKNSILVLFGIKTWVGYSNEHNKQLPPLKKGVLSTNGINTKNFHTEAIEHQLNYRYAKNYTYYEDFDILLSNWNRL